MGRYSRKLNTGILRCAQNDKPFVMAVGMKGNQEGTMRKLIVFNHVSLDGYFVDSNGRMDWARTAADDEEWNVFVAENAKGGGPLLFGRVTYELMNSFWPTPMASAVHHDVAERMNMLPKVVFSKTLGEAAWSNTRLVRDMVPAIRKMKQEPGENMTIMGSGSVVSQLAAEGLIDEFHVVVNPIVLGKGRTMFEGIGERMPLTLTKSRAFSNGCTYLCYERLG